MFMELRYFSVSAKYRKVQQFNVKNNQKASVTGLSKTLKNIGHRLSKWSLGKLKTYSFEQLTLKIQRQIRDLEVQKATTLINARLKNALRSYLVRWNTNSKIATSEKNSANKNKSAKKSKSEINFLVLLLKNKLRQSFTVLRIESQMGGADKLSSTKKINIIPSKHQLEEEEPVLFKSKFNSTRNMDLS